MRSTLISSAVWVGISAVIGLAGTGCTETECGPGTINRGGTCQPADETVGVAKCGPFTELRGDQCVPVLPATKCDPGTTQPDVDPTTGVTTCIGTGGGGCSAPLACPNSTAGQQTVCGQIYNFADNTPFAAQGATGAKCEAGATTGPCALKINPYAPVGTMNLSPLGMYLDDCGRFRIDLDVSKVIIGFTLQFDDVAGATDQTVPTLVGVAKVDDGTATKNVETFILDKDTLAKWTGAPALATGIYTAIFREHACDASGKCNGDRFANKAGVVVGLDQERKAGMIGPVSYFAAATTHLALDSAAIKTTLNGAALTSVTAPGTGTDTLTYISGSGGLTDTTNCKWSSSTALKYPNYVYFQVFRPINNGSQTCTL